MPPFRFNAIEMFTSVFDCLTFIYDEAVDYKGQHCCSVWVTFRRSAGFIYETEMCCFYPDVHEEDDTI